MDTLADILTEFNSTPDAPPAPAPATALPAKAKALWPSRLPFDVAAGLSDENQLLALYEITPKQLESYCLNPMFRKEVAEYRRYISENGITFKMKSRLQAEEYLEELHDLVISPETPASVRLAAIQAVVKWAELEPVQQKTTANSSSQTTKIEIAWLSPEKAPQMAARVTTTTEP